MLIRIGEEEFYRQVIRRAQFDIEVRIELIFVIVSRQHRGVVDTAPCSLRARNDKCCIGVLRVQKIERHRIYVRAVRGHSHASESPSLAAKSRSQACCRADQRYGRNTQYTNAACP